MEHTVSISFGTDTEKNIAEGKSLVYTNGRITFTENSIYIGLGNGKAIRYDGYDTRNAVRFDPDITNEGDAIAKGPGILFYDTNAKAVMITVQVKDAVTTQPLLEGIVTQGEIDKLQVDLSARFVTANALENYYTKDKTYSREEIINLAGNFTVIQNKLEEEIERATAAETKLQTEIDNKTKAITYKADIAMKTNDFIVYGQSIYLVVNPFTTSGNFGTDEHNLFKLNSSGSGGTKVIDYAVGAKIEEGNMVIHEGGIYLCKNTIESCTNWEADKINMVDFSASIDLSNYYNKSEIQAQMANKQDKLTLGSGVKVEQLDNAINISADMTTDATASKIVQRDDKGVVYAKNSSNPTGDELVNAGTMRVQLDTINQSFKDLRDEVVGATKEFFIMNQTLVVSQGAEAISLDFQTNISVDNIEVANPQQEVLNINLSLQKATVLVDPQTKSDVFPITVTLSKGGNKLVDMVFNLVGAENMTKSVSNYQSNTYKVYTVVINKAEARNNPTGCCYLADDAVGKSMDEIMEFLGIKPVILSNGVEAEQLDPNDYTKKTNGQAATLAIGLDTMVKFPKRGVRFKKEGSLYYISITNQENAIGFDYDAFKKDKVFKSQFYYGAYMGYVLNGKLYSTNDVLPTVNTTQTAFRNYAKARGEGYQLPSYHMIKYIQACYLLVHQSLDSQTTVGRGRDSGGSVCKTGGSNTWGMNMEKAPSNAKTSGTTNVKCLGIEDLWGNAWTCIDGVWLDPYYRLCLSTNPDNYNDTGNGYYVATSVGENVYAGSDSMLGNVSDVVCNNAVGLFPSRIEDGASNRYFCDGLWQKSSKCAYFGGSWYNGASDGVFCWTLDAPASAAYSSKSAVLAWL